MSPVHPIRAREAFLVAGACLAFAGSAAACDLMGYSFNREVKAHELFDRFRELSPRNRDGWGEPRMKRSDDAGRTWTDVPVPKSWNYWNTHTSRPGSTFGRRGRG